MTEPIDPAMARARFRRTLTRVMVMQLAALLALWWLQVAFTP